jgi:hypothetical protein
MLKELMIHHYFLILFVLTGLAVAVVSFVHQRADQENLKSSNDVTGAVYNMIGVLLALILGFLIVEAYSDYSTASSEAQAEASQLKQIYHLADLFDDEQKAKIQAATTNFILSIRNEEWPSMLERKFGHPQTNQYLKELWNVIRSIKSKNDVESLAFEKIIDHIGEAKEFRSERLRQVHSNIPTALWVLFVCVAFVSVLSLGLFGNINLRQQRVLAGMVTMVLASCIFMIHMLDNPYIGPLKIEPEAFFVESADVAGKPG